MIDCILNKVKGFLGIGEVGAAATQQVPREIENRRFVVIADPVVMAFFEEQTRNLSDRSVELINEYEADDDKIYRLSQFDFTCTMSSSTGDGKRRDEYYDTCRALMKIFLNNCPVVDDGFGHRVLFTEKENGKLGTWGCCIHYTMANFAKREKRDPELIRRIRKFGIDLIDSKKAIF